MKHKLSVVAGDKLEIKVTNKKNKEEWSIFTMTVGKKAYQGDFDGDDGCGFFLAESTGYEE